MKKYIFFITCLLAFPFASYCQYRNLQHNIETDLGCVIHDNKIGSTLETRYAMGIANHCDLLASISLSQGIDPERVENMRIHSQFHSGSIQLGVRGHLDYLKICSLKLSCQGGVAIIEKVLVNTNTAVSNANWHPILAGKIEQCFKISTITQLGLFYDKGWLFSTQQPQFDRFGLTLSFKIE